MSRVRFEPTISAGERSKTYALDHAATGIGNVHELQKIGYSYTISRLLFSSCNVPYDAIRILKKLGTLN